MAQRPAQEPPLPAADRPADGEALGGVFEVSPEWGRGVAGERDELGVAEDVAEHRLGALVVRVELVEGVPESLLWIANRTPGTEIGPRIGGEVVGRARGEQVGLGREVAVQGAALDAGALGNRAHGRAGRPDAPVQLDRRLGDPQVRLGNLFGSLLQLVLALGWNFMTHCCVANLDRSSRAAYGHISVTHYCLPKGSDDVHCHA